MIRVFLVDDEPLAIAGLRALLMPHADVTITGEALSGRDAIEQIIALEPDLVFLDIQMPRVDGFDVLEGAMRRLRPGARMPEVIFVTAFDEFAVQAFEVSALDYLLKPVDEERFRAALQRARASLTRTPRTEGSLEQRLRDLLEDYAAVRGGTERGGYRSRIMVSIGPRSLMVDVEQIDWIGSRDYCAELHVGEKTYVIREALTLLETRLNPAVFTRIHRSVIVNLTRVKELRRRTARGGTAVLTDGTQLPVSRNRRARLLELMNLR
ncbi:MAG: LytTR family DNA-binding domain-containing protein [Gemmatimonadota bacterium]